MQPVSSIIDKKCVTYSVCLVSQHCLQHNLQSVAQGSAMQPVFSSIEIVKDIVSSLSNSDTIKSLA